VLATTIDKYCYISCRYLPPFFEHRFRIVYSKIENCKNIDEILHPAVREVLRFLNISRGVEIHHDGDLPARSGLGTSSAFTVGLLHAVHALKGEIVAKEQLARESLYLEQQVLKETVGSQDQILAAYGGFNQITFLPNGDFHLQPMTLEAERVEELNAHLMLFYTGIKRTATQVAESYVSDMDGRKRQLRLLKEMVDEAVSILNGNEDVRLFGELLHEAWQTKRSLSSMVSNSHIEQIYDQARSAGAIGGKLIGAGGGGFMLLFVPPEKQDVVREALKKLIYVPFKFESRGSQIIFYDREVDYAFVEENHNHESSRVFQELEHLSVEAR
jgi:D-glycero-alpha-D-manno-heptose-7-phosphate kinase